MIRMILARLTLLLLLTAAAVPRQAQAGPARPAPDPASIPFVDRTVTTGDGSFRYEVFVPRHWDRHRQSPVILFLHGSGERGDDNRAQTRNGIRLLIAQDPAHFPCVVVCPQCRPEKRWTQPDMAQMALAALDQSVREFHGDPKRVYLTGLSLGGYATWAFAQQYPTRWAAVAPCCGGIVFPGPHTASPGRDAAGAAPTDPYYAAALKVANFPAWVFHGQADPTVPVSESRQMVALLLSQKADVRYTEYPGVGHNSWDYAYKETGLLPWFLSHKRAR